MNPKVRFRQTLLPLLEELTICPVDAAFRSIGARMEREFIHLDIAEDGAALDHLLRETGWNRGAAQAGSATYSLGDHSVLLTLRTGVPRG